MKKQLLLILLLSSVCFSDIAYGGLFQDGATITRHMLRGREYELAKKSLTRIYRSSTWPAKSYKEYTNGDPRPGFGLGPDQYVRPAGFREKMKQLYDATFSAADKNIAKGCDLDVILYIDTNGNVIGVAFDFSDNRGWSLLPLEKWALFDEKIMAANFKFQVTSEGKRWNYMLTVWSTTP